MRRALTALVAGAAVLSLAPQARSEIRVDVRVTEEVGHAAFVEFTSDQAAWIVLYGSFSDGSLRALGPAIHSPEWVPANERRVISVELLDGLHLESVQAVASPRWFDPRQLWIAAAPERQEEEHVSAGNAEGLWT
jgi:hypothetical protein